MNVCIWLCWNSVGVVYFKYKYNYTVPFIERQFVIYSLLNNNNNNNKMGNGKDKANSSTNNNQNNSDDYNWKINNQIKSQINS